MDLENEQDEHRAQNAAQDAADAEFFASIPDPCTVDECDQPGTEDYHVTPRGICDPEEESRWPVVRFCKPHMREITGGDG
jgi:hypothetical protein